MKKVGMDSEGKTILAEKHIVGIKAKMIEPDGFNKWKQVDKEIKGFFKWNKKIFAFEFFLIEDYTLESIKTGRVLFGDNAIVSGKIEILEQKLTQKIYEDRYINRMKNYVMKKLED